MSLFARAFSFATMTVAAALVASFGTPGFARELSEAVNVPSPLPVPVLREGVAPQADPATPALSNLVGTRPGDVVAFGTLAAAVAAQPAAEALGADPLAEDLSCMAGAIYFESKGEPLSGQLAVAEVILNRSRSGRFPRSICSVVTQPGQFSFVRGGRVPAVAANAAYRTAVAVARVALGEMWDSPASDAMYFHARRAAPGWGRTAVATIGNHIFYR